jgi:hypothetical protein
MIAWAMWFSEVQVTDYSGVDVTKIDYSQALVIAAWTFSVVAGGAGAALSGGQ